MYVYVCMFVCSDTSWPTQYVQINKTACVNHSYYSSPAIERNCHDNPYFCSPQSMYFKHNGSKYFKSTWTPLKIIFGLLQKHKLKVHDLAGLRAWLPYS